MANAIEKKLTRHSPSLFSTDPSPTSLKVIMSSTAEMLNTLSSMAGQIEMLQAMLRGANGAVIELKAKKEIKEDKPKREMSEGLKAWHTFNKRIDTVLKEAEKTFKRVAESKKFASHLKKLKATEEWADAEILEEREKWVETPVETKVTEVTEVNESAEVSETSSDEGKKAGRPKMTEEEKAAAKVKREAKKAAMTEEEIAEAKAKKEAAKAKKAAMSDEETKLKTPVKKSKIGSAPGAPKKEAKVAWADSDATDVMKELDEHLASE